MLKMKDISVNLLSRFYGIYAILMFTGVTIPALMLVALVPGEDNRREIARSAAKLWLWLLAARLTVAGDEQLPARPCVVVANHASYLDGIILTAVLPARFTFVIKKEMTRIPFVNFFLARLGSSFVDRSSHHRAAADARRILNLATQKKSIAFFPEGTFSAEPGLKRFRNGAFTVAQRGDLPVVPVIIRGSRQMLPAKHWLPVPSRIEVLIKPPVEADPEKISPEELMRACRNSILESLEEPDVAPPGRKEADLE
jgi:1-acyl-sn-glycerol-3-phosphate acyltransferase